MDKVIYNCIIDEDLDDETGIYAMSFVEFPANEMSFVTLHKDKKVFLAEDKVKHILTGVVLRPDQQIYRNDPTNGEYYIQFSEDQIEKIAQKMMRTGLALHTTTHQHQSDLQGNYLTELWIVQDPKNDKSNALGFTDLPKGTLMCSYKVTPAYWDENVTTGNVKGFSLEGFFRQCKVDLSKIKKPINNNNKRSMSKNKLSYMQRKFLSAVGVSKAILDAVDETQSGEDYRVFRLADGKEVFVDNDGYVTIDGEALPSGDHVLDDGKIMVVDADNKLVEVRENDKKDDSAKTIETLAKQNKFLLGKLQKLESAGESIDNKDDEIKRVEDRKKNLEDELERVTKELKDVTDELERVRSEKADVEKENTELKRNTASTPPTRTQTNMSAVGSDPYAEVCKQMYNEKNNK